MPKNRKRESLNERRDVPQNDTDKVIGKSLTELDLSKNKLRILGPYFCTLVHLVTLNLSQNELSALPENFGSLRSLRYLDLRDNKLKDLPLSFGSLSNLRHLDLKKNPLLPVLADVVGTCANKRDCYESAKRTVKFFARLQIQTAQMLELESTKDTIIGNGVLHNNQLGKANGDLKTQNKKRQNRRNRSKNDNNHKKGKIILNNHIEPKKDDSAALVPVPTPVPKPNKNKSTKAKRSGNTSITALVSIFLFIMLLAVNVGVIYLVVFKNPEIVDKLIEFIPAQYRNWLMTKTRFLSFQVSDWISEFRTAPDEN